MAPKNAGVCEITDIRVPPPYLTDVEVFDYFPELLSESEGFVSVFTDGNRLKRKGQQKYKKQKEQSISSTLSSIHGTFDIENHGQYVSCCRRTNTSKLALLEERRAENLKQSNVIFDSENVEARNDLWQIAYVDEREDRVVEETEVRIVDVPHFDVSNSALWDDVDTFVSVVDVSGSDVMEEEREPVCILDTHRTSSSAWGLDIIWEHEEEYL